MKSLKKESRLRIPTSKFLEAAENIKGWRWLPWALRRTSQGRGSWMGFTTWDLEDGGDIRMEVKITVYGARGEAYPIP